MHTRFWLDYIAALKFLLSGDWADAKAVYDARKEFYSLKKSYLPIRRENLARTILHPVPELMQESLILAFYFKRKKKYSAL
jgi:hypothetical protein